MTLVIKPSITNVFDVSEFAATVSKQSGFARLNNSSKVILKNLQGVLFDIPSECFPKIYI